MSLRNYTNTAPPVTLSVTVSPSDTTLQVPSTAGYPSAPFTLGIERGTTNEEVCLCTAKTATSFTVTRGYDNTSAIGHTSTKSVEHCVASIDYIEANFHINDQTHDHHTQYLRKAILTTKGDIYVATAAGTLTRLGVGQDGTILTADATQGAGLKWAAVLPAGSMVLYGGASAPAGWYLCDGSVVTQAGDPALFAIVGSTFNTGGELASEFRLPDFRSRMPVGAGQGASLSNRVRGARGGEEAHSLTTGEMPSHNHSISDTGHVHGPSGGSSYIMGGGTGLQVNFGTNAVAASTTFIAATGISINFTGGTGAHNTMAPFLVVQYIVKR